MADFTLDSGSLKHVTSKLFLIYFSQHDVKILDADVFKPENELTYGELDLGFSEYSACDATAAFKTGEGVVPGADLSPGQTPGSIQEQQMRP